MMEQEVEGHQTASPLPLPVRSEAEDHVQMATVEDQEDQSFLREERISSRRKKRRKSSKKLEQEEEKANRKVSLSSNVVTMQPNGSGENGVRKVSKTSSNFTPFTDPNERQSVVDMKGKCSLHTEFN